MKSFSFNKLFKTMPFERFQKVTEKITAEKNSARIIEMLSKFIPEVNKLEDPK